MENKMTFTDTDKLKALAIINVFETSRPFGDYAACVVLNDGAGISYGINQFTHRSGSLLAVVERFLKIGGKIGSATMIDCLPDLRRHTASAIVFLTTNERLKSALKAAAVTREMKAAQTAVAFELYLMPVIVACQRRGYVEPLSLAVLYDSIVHGSFARIARGVRSNQDDERAWITEYVRRRDAWLASFPRLASTRYRTRFFLNQIAISNWTLRLPLNVHGVRLTDQTFERLTAVEPTVTPTALQPTDSVPPKPTETSALIPQAQPPMATESTLSIFESVGETVASASDRLDRIENTVNAVTSRKDAAKSLWTTVLGTFWQVVWAIFGFVAGLPKIVWITVAALAAILMLAYLYRQIELGRIREHKELR